MLCSEWEAEEVKEEKAGVHKARFSRTVLHLCVVLRSLGSFTELRSVKSPEEGIQQAYYITSNSKHTRHFRLQRMKALWDENKTDDMIPERRDDIFLAYMEQSQSLISGITVCMYV